MRWRDARPPYQIRPRVLVDLDLSKDIFYEVIVEREGFGFPSMSQEEVGPTAADATQLEIQLVVFSPNHGVKSGITFHMSLQNVSDEFVRPPLPNNDVQPVLSLISDFQDIRKIMVDPDDLPLQLESQDDNAQEISFVAISHPSFLEHDNVHEISDADIVIIEVQIVKDQHIQPVQISSTLGQHQEVHSNKNIQHDLELWARI
ncbi:hypothetical protein MTR_1g033920 [Medicago truncatula]|uniref:Uncharacterized protein n=1 Tax=Medicago truncatula TaxID=3880 RepID=A0A072VG02_MEDTR|nr:hypothetical protein MTR_1g033920 [Medicago truncatula]